jgi:hypothetical protein
MGIIKSANYKFLGVYISPKLLDALREQATQQRETVSEVVRRILMDALRCAE